jgi:hypothetical protein
MSDLYYIFKGDFEGGKRTNIYVPSIKTGRIKKIWWTKCTGSEMSLCEEMSQYGKKLKEKFHSWTKNVTTYLGKRC